MDFLPNLNIGRFSYTLLVFLENLRGALAILNYELVTATVNVNSGFGKNYRTEMISVSAENSGFGRSLPISVPRRGKSRVRK